MYQCRGTLVRLGAAALSFCSPRFLAATAWRVLAPSLPCRCSYANEVLQNQFNADVFKQQQREYEAEGVPWQHVDYQASRYMTVT